MKGIFYAKSVEGQLEFSNKRELATYLADNDNKTFIVTIDRETGKRTNDQNSALHLWYSMVADTLNQGGYTVQSVVNQAIDIDWNGRLVKELLWKRAQERITGKKSTTELDKSQDIDLVYDHLCRHLGEKFGIEVPPFPHDPDKNKPADIDYPESNSPTAFD